MIIKYPTGLYQTVLPKNPEDAGNVTFLISTTLPPRSDLLFPKVPFGIIDKKKAPREITLIDRRNTVGSLVFSISRASRKEEGNNSRQYEIGQVLEFNEVSGKAVAPMLVRDVTEIRHDTNIIDYEKMGLTSEEEQAIAELSLLTQDQLSDRLNEYKRLRSDAEQIVNVQQKLINDITRTINSLRITLDEGPTTGSAATESSLVEQLVAKLVAKRDVAFATRDQAVADANWYAANASRTLDQLRAVGILVK